MTQTTTQVRWHTIQALTAEMAPPVLEGTKSKPHLSGQYAEWPEPIRRALSLAVEQHDSPGCQVCDTPVGYPLEGDPENDVWHCGLVQADGGEIEYHYEDCEQVLHVIGASI